MAEGGIAGYFGMVAHVANAVMEPARSQAKAADTRFQNGGQSITATSVASTHHRTIAEEVAAAQGYGSGGYTAAPPRSNNLYDTTLAGRII